MLRSSVVAALLAVPVLAVAAPTIQEDLDEVRAEVGKVEKLLAENTRESAGRAAERLTIVKEKLGKFSERLAAAKIEEKGNAKPPVEAEKDKRKAMADEDFRQIMVRVKDAKSASLRETLLKTSLEGQLLTAKQVLDILRTYKVSSERLIALENLAPKLLERKGDIILQDAFTTSSDKEAALKILAK